MTDPTMHAALAAHVLQAAEARGAHIVTAESCTGGLIAAALTDIAGSSTVFDRGFVTYSNAAKMEMLDVTAASLDRFGAVSEAVAKEMAFGALARSMADLAVSVTGIAGPGGGSADKPVGLVWFAVAEQGMAPEAARYVFDGADRASIRRAATETGLSLLLDRLK